MSVFNVLFNVRIDRFSSTTLRWSPTLHSMYCTKCTLQTRLNYHLSRLMFKRLILCHLQLYNFVKNQVVCRFSHLILSVQISPTVFWYTDFINFFWLVIDGVASYEVNPLLFKQFYSSYYVSNIALLTLDFAHTCFRQSVHMLARYSTTLWVFSNDIS